MRDAPRFFVDVGSPYAWLAAERVAGGALGDDVVWEPVLAGAVFAARGFGSWSLTDARAEGIGVPTVVVGNQAFWGDDRLGDAAAALAA